MSFKRSGYFLAQSIFVFLLIDYADARNLMFQDSLYIWNPGDTRTLMNHLFGLSDSHLHHWLFSDFLCNSGHAEISKIQQILKPDEIMMEYYLTDTSLSIFIISNSGFTIHEHRLNKNFREVKEKYQRKIRLADITELASLSHLLYLELFAPVRELLLGKKRIILIPGKDLLDFPFEALVVGRITEGKATHFNNYHYLIQDFEITYHYSACSWLDTFIIPSKEDEACSPMIDFTGYLPVYNQNSEIPPLPYARLELSSISELFKQKGLKANVISGEHSLFLRFTEEVLRSRIIHLAAHSFPSPIHFGLKEILFPVKMDTDPQHDDHTVLTCKDIGSQTLQAELIVLNTCSSAATTSRQNSKWISLPLGFIKAGAKNILSTLWDVTDPMAYRIVLCFYQKWLSGKTFSQALREVKLELIRYRETALPTIWASYILIGR